MRTRSVLACSSAILAVAFAACSSDKENEGADTTRGSSTDSAQTTGSAETTSDASASSSDSASTTGGSPVQGAYDCSAAEGAMPDLTTRTIADGFARPLFVTAAPGDNTRLFVVEQFGSIRVIENGTTVSEPYLDLEDRVQSSQNDGDERGLLGLAFHPDYAENGLFYVNYSAPRSGNTTVSEFSVTDDANVADPDSERVVLTQEQPAANHNGGMLAFGPDGYLHIGFGDGGGGGDQYGNGQNLGSMLATISRIDVDDTSSGEYGIPAGNMTGNGALPEILHYGVRNPWRFSFDACTGDLYIGDVGQDDLEEVDVIPAGAGNLNLGWPIKEASSCYQANTCDESGLTDPVLEYGHGDGVSVTGGYVYRGSEIPGLRGYYFYADYGSEVVWTFRYEAGEALDQQVVNVGGSGGITAFGQDNSGEIYIVRRPGEIQKIVAQ